LYYFNNLIEGGSLNLMVLLLFGNWAETNRSTSSDHCQRGGTSTSQ